MIFVILLAIGAVAYLVIAMVLNFQRSTGVLVFFLLIVSYYGWAFVEYKYGNDVFEAKIVQPIEEVWESERYGASSIIVTLERIKTRIIIAAADMNG